MTVTFSECHENMIRELMMSFDSKCFPNEMRLSEAEMDRLMLTEPMGIVAYDANTAVGFALLLPE